MSYENHNTKQIDYDYRRRDLQGKYSYAISRLGVATSQEEKSGWLNELNRINDSLAELNTEYAQR